MKEKLKELPDKWYCEVTKDNKDVLETWRLSKCSCKNKIHNTEIGFSVISKHFSDNSFIYYGDIKKSENYKDYTEISFEDFKRLVLKEETMIKQEEFNNNTPIKISSDTLFSYFKAATDIQKEYLTKHFQLDGSTTVGSIKGLYELACPDWKPKIKANHPNCFKEDIVWKREILNDYNNKYWFLERDYSTGFKTNAGSITSGNMNVSFTTQQEADNNALLYNTMMLMRSWAKFYNEVDGFKADWNASQQDKYMLRLEANKIYVVSYWTHNTGIFHVVLKSQKRAEEMLAEFKDDLEKLIQLGMFN